MTIAIYFDNLLERTQVYVAYKYEWWSTAYRVKLPMKKAVALRNELKRKPGIEVCFIEEDLEGKIKIA